MKRRTTALLIALCLGLCGCSGTQVNLPEPDSSAAVSPVRTLDKADPDLAPEGYVPSVQNDELALYISEDNQAVAVWEKATGYLWESTVREERLSRKANKKWESQLRSLFVFSYALTGDTKGDTRTGCSAADATAVVRTDLPDGVRLHFTMGKLKLELAIELRLDGENLVVSIPDSAIRDGEKTNLISVDLLPYFGAAADTDEGYFFYPNGLGELFYFKEEALRQNALKAYTIPYYFSATVNIGALEKNDREHTDIQAMLPVYGVKIGKSAFVTTVESGDAYAALNVAPGGVSVGINRIYNTFTYRKSYGVFGSSISIAGGSSVFPLAVLLDAERYAGDRIARYTFLGGDQADYSGMANAVREHLIATKRLPSSPVGGKVPVILDVLGGIQEEKLFFRFFKPLTTFEQTEAMVRELVDDGVPSTVVVLRGWEKSGLLAAPQTNSVSGRLGGVGGLKKLADTCRNTGTGLFLQVNYTDIYTGNGGYSLNTDAARDPNHYMYTNSEESHFLMRPVSALKRLSGIQSKAKDWGVSGLSFARLGSLVYSDHNEKNPCLTDQTILAWQEMLRSGSASFGSAAVSGGNLYTLAHARYLSEIPEKSVSVAFGDETVPFYQMVVHGSVYYTGTQNNLFYDKTAQTLKMVEYGYVPYYELTAVNSKELRGTGYDTLFSSAYTDWREDIVSAAKQFNDRLGSTYGAYMIRHEKLTDTVFCVSYSDGTAVYVNYGETAYEKNGVTVDGLAYTVVSKDGAA